MSERGHSETVVRASSRKESDKQRLAELEKRVRELETTLHVANAKLDIALEMGKLSAWERDLETDKMTGTATFMTTLGLPSGAEPTFEELERIFHPADMERVRQAIAYAERTNTRINIEHRIIKPDGRITRILVQGGHVYEDGKPVRHFGIVQDITEREKIKEDIQHAQRRQEFLLELNDQLRSLDDPDAIMETTAQSLGWLLKVDCAGYGEVDESRGVILVEREWSKGVISNEGRAYRLYDFLPTMMAELKQGRPIFVEDIRNDPRASNPAVQTAYSTINARSALAVPLLKDQKLTAILYMHSAEPRAWTADDLTLAEDVAERTWTAVEKARAEMDLRETDAKLRLIAESLPALVWILNPQTELLYTNQRWVTYSGLSSEEALGHSWMRAIHPDDMARMQEELVPVVTLHTAYTTEARYRSHEGHYRWHLIQGAPIHSSTGEFKGWVGTSVDIHDLKQTEKALRKSEERLRLALQAAKMGDWSWDSVTNLVSHSDHAAEIVGVAPGTRITPEQIRDRIHPADLPRMREAKEKARETGQPYSVQYRMRRFNDGAEIWIATQAQTTLNEDGTLVTSGIIQDITDRRHSEERQQLLIRELHHRVKNTLATVQAIVGSTARTASSIDEFYQGFVGRIVSLARTHNLLTEDLWQKAALEDLIQTELGPYEDGARNRILVEGPHVELPSEAAVPIGMAIHELTTNAAKHGALSTFGGQVEVRWHVEPGAERPILHFAWTEHGGPKVSTPTRQGFGSRLLQRVLATQLQAEVSMNFPEEGLRFTMTMPIPGTPPIFNPDRSEN
ncbi:PAS domain-containing protein [Microvirga terrestris]|uniref:Blue-light-activated histidine kinase n=1 Tax=Microvirga terrestris TaxID=2791024 RepID=A0ABS0HP75_9HYPH|nr:PAS domain-containing protein [Microvirga terrestris]MBF9195273.1 PAS domain-containing protein [Microvirga terrestris]